MEALNFLRQARRDISDDYLLALEVDHPADARSFARQMVWAESATKFVLPKDGTLLDNGLRGVPDSLKLPYPMIVLEFEMNPITEEADEGGGVSSTKRIVFAFQKGESSILVSQISHNDSTGEWVMSPYMGLVTRDPDWKSAPATTAWPIPQIPGAEFSVMATGTIAETFYPGDWTWMASEELSSAAYAVLSLLEALSCSNVETQPIPRKKQKKGQKLSAIRGALPFHEYHSLVIQVASEQPESIVTASSHRSPREHLRRGHIRQYQSGKKIWINSMIVNPGVGGRIEKDYVVRGACHA
jgi:hypothetical protein